MRKYNVDIYTWLDTAQEGIYVFKEFVSPINMDKFIQAVKNYIDAEMDLKLGFSVDFNSDYTKLQKSTWQGLRCIMQS